jgi:hypothetical protein
MSVSATAGEIRLARYLVASADSGRSAIAAPRERSQILQSACRPEERVIFATSDVRGTNHLTKVVYGSGRTRMAARQHPQIDNRVKVSNKIFRLGTAWNSYKGSGPDFGAEHDWQSKITKHIEHRKYGVSTGPDSIPGKRTISRI